MIEDVKKSVDDIKKKIGSLSRRVEKASTELVKLTNVLKEVCPHEKTIQESRYVSGGYLNTDYTDYKTVCDCCGKTLKEWTVEHGNYA